MDALKLLLFIAFVRVIYEDFNDRLVYWFWFPTILVCSGVLLHANIGTTEFLTILPKNFSMVLVLLLVVAIYAKLKLKSSFKKVMGLGDVLLFIALVFSFPTVPFIVLMVFGLIFALVLHLLLNNTSKVQTVPLAGYLSLFFCVCYLAHWTGLVTSLYTA